MSNYFKYLLVSQEDKNWGIYVLNAGFTSVPAASEYPAKSHRSIYYYRWPAGRVLDEYQIIYISRGKGIFESDHCPQLEVQAGSLLLLFPGESHRYKPSAETGWDEYWIGCKGPSIDQLVAHHFFSKESPCLRIGFSQSIIKLFNDIIDASRAETNGNQPLMAGAVLHLLGQCYQMHQKNNTIISEKETIIQKAQAILAANIDEDFSPELVAHELGVSYSWFRKEFKQQLDISPGQYLLHLKIERAKLLLSNSAITIKEIAYLLHFNSPHHFSRLFKEKNGLSPVEYRKQLVFTST